MRLYRRLFRRQIAEKELDAELRFHLEQQTAHYIAAGMKPEEARRRTRLEFGGLDQVKEECRDVGVGRFVETLFQDLRYGFRQLRRNPGFTVVAVLTLALGIGANTAVFSVVNSVLLQPLPYPHADRLIWLTNYDKDLKQDVYGSRADYVIWKKDAHSFESMTAYGNENLSVMVDGKSFETRVASITGDFWSMTGATATLGHLFPSRATHTIVLSYGFFERQFAGDPQVIGKTLNVNGHPFVVTGILRKNFRFLFPQQSSSEQVPPRIDAYIPIPNAVGVPGGVITQKDGPAPFWVCVVGKLRPHVPIATARAQMETIYHRIAQEYPTSPPRSNTVLHVVPLHGKLTANVKPALLVLLGAVGFVLLIACGNISNLLLARASARHKEVAIRASLGAGRRRVLRQFLTESVLLALLGGAAGLVFAKWSLAVMIRMGATIIPRVGLVQIDGYVLLFALGISITTGLLFGLAPALSFWRGNWSDGFRDDTQNSAMRTSRTRVRNWMAAAELALTLALLTGAGLMLKSYWQMNSSPPGFDPGKILTMRVPLSGRKYKAWLPEQEYIRQLIRRAGELPGVQAVGVDLGTLHTSFRVEGTPAVSPDLRQMAAFRAVSPGFLRVMGVALLRGRWPRKDEALNDLVINERFARMVFGKTDPIGNQINAGFLKGTIVGVVANFKFRKLDASPEPSVYFPYQLSPQGRSIGVVVRVSRNPEAVAPAIRKLAANIDPSQPLYRMTTLEQSLARSIAPRRFNLFLLAAFAGVALMMACVGVYGVMTYSVTRRTHEIGIRLALGATHKEVMRMIIWEGMKVVGAGLVCGIAGALVVTQFIASLLYDVTPTDPLTFIAVSVILTTVALLACYIPARRAAKVDPMVALRYE